MFVTAFCGVFDSKTGVLDYSCAGHNPPRLVRHNSPKIGDLDRAQSVPLGLDPQAQFLQASIGLSSGDTVLLYTDGIVEARSADGDWFGLKRLDQVLRDTPLPRGSQSMVKAVCDAVEAFAWDGTLQDDQTLVEATLCGGS